MRVLKQTIHLRTKKKGTEISNETGGKKFMKRDDESYMIPNITDESSRIPCEKMKSTAIQNKHTQTNKKHGSKYVERYTIF